MLIVPFLQDDGGLYLDAYSDNNDDFKNVKEVLTNAGVKPEAHDMDNPGKRINKRFIVDKSGLDKLELYLKANFVKDTHRNIVEFDNEGDPYVCKEIGKDGSNGGSTIKFLAKNPRVAAVKAGLIANNNRWHDAVAEPADHSKK